MLYIQLYKFIHKYAVSVLPSTVPGANCESFPAQSGDAALERRCMGCAGTQAHLPRESHAGAFSAL